MDGGPYFTTPANRICPYETRFCQMGDGRLVAIVWAFDQQAGPGADFLGDLAATPLFPGANIGRADLQRLGGDGMSRLKLMAAFLADVIVGRHGKPLN